MCVSIICRKHHVKASKFAKGTMLKGSIQYVPHVALLHFHPHETYLRMLRLSLVLQLLALSPASVLMYSSRSDTLEIHNALKQF
jgi:hypothetical protein